MTVGLGVGLGIGYRYRGASTQKGAIIVLENSRNP